MSREIICKVKNITKTFPGVRALDDVSFDIEKGAIHAIVGENGAGKSTLMNILSGVYHPNGGTIEFEGEEVEFLQPRDAQECGIAMIHQELSLSPHMSAMENIYEGRMPKNRFGFIDRKKMYKDCDTYLKRLGVEYIDPKTLVKNLTISEMQLLEIAKAMSHHARMLIMDEPTSSLTTNEIEFLLKIVKGFRDEGMAVLYISHKLEEIMEIADTITVLRDGEHIATKPKEEMSEQAMIELMVGREFESQFSREYLDIDAYSKKTPLLEVKDLSDVSGRVKNVSFDLYEGEVLGLTGLVGAGRSELLETIFGARHKKSGQIFIQGEEIDVSNTKEAINHGMALVPEGRKIQGLFLKLSVKDNMTMVFLKEMRNMIGLIDGSESTQLCNEYVDMLDIRTPSLAQQVENLSGGNQQKTIIARWLMNSPRILFMDEPTQGIDIGAKTEIYKIIDELSQQGVSVVFLSSEMPEVLSMCDRIMVMHEGEVRGVLNHDEADQVKIMSYTLES